MTLFDSMIYGRYLMYNITHEGYGRFWCVGSLLSLGLRINDVKKNTDNDCLKLTCENGQND